MTNRPTADKPSPIWRGHEASRLSSIGNAAPMSAPTPKPNACPIKSVPGPVPFKLSMATIANSGVHGINLMIGPPGNCRCRRHAFRVCNAPKIPSNPKTIVEAPSARCPSMPITAIRPLPRKPAMVIDSSPTPAPVSVPTRHPKAKPQNTLDNTCVASECNVNAVRLRHHSPPRTNALSQIPASCQRFIPSKVPPTNR